MTAATMCAPPQTRTLPGQPGSLWSIFATYRWRILATYGLFSLENLLRLAQPLVLGWAIHGLLQSSMLGLAIFLGQHVLYLAIASARRLNDTRCFTRIHADLATGLVLDQRGRAVEVSRVAARSALSREVVDFFERDVVLAIYCLYSVIGALAMLTWADLVLVPWCLALLLPAYLLSIWTGRQSLILNGRLNDEVEREVEIIERARPAEVRGHFDLIRRWRIALSDRDAFSYGALETLIFVAMAAALVRTCARPGVDAGTIFAVLGYVLMYVSGIANVPLLVQQFNRLRDISRRMQFEIAPKPEVTHANGGGASQSAW
ncbi:MAG: ABC transporter six-transmembrane domain-containing protein [Hyphomicrobiaceae bacterium]